MADYITLRFNPARAGGIRMADQIITPPAAPEPKAWVPYVTLLLGCAAAGWAVYAASGDWKGAVGAAVSFALAHFLRPIGR